MHRRLVEVGLGAIVAWLSALALFGAYVNWFSESVRSGGSLVLGSAWLAVLIALALTLAAGVMVVVAITDRVRSHA